MTGPASRVLPAIDDVKAAARTLRGVAVRTPLLDAHMLRARTGARVLVKPEMLQRTGSFKFRGAYNCIANIPPAERAAGVVAFSSGNHAQGVAGAARLFGIPAVIVMPADAPDLKRARTAALGADIVLYDRYREDRAAIAATIARERGARLVPPFDDPFVIAGQGTVGLEMADDLAAMDVAPDLVLVPASGGGLMAGTALAIRARFPDAGLMTVEPDGFDDHARSLAAGHREPHREEGVSICDALLASIPGELTFAINRSLVAGGVTVSDAEVADAMRVAFAELKLVVEPGGAVALAALLSGKVEARDRNVAVVLSGGNVDHDLYADIIAGRFVPAARTRPS